MLGPFLMGFFLMWLAQLGLAVFGWSRGNNMTVSGFRIHWDNARFRDLVFVLRLVVVGMLVIWALPRFPELGALLYAAGIVIAFFVPAASELPVVLMERWSVKPPPRTGPTTSNRSEGKGRGGRDL